MPKSFASMSSADGVCLRTQAEYQNRLDPTVHSVVCLLTRRLRSQASPARVFSAPRRLFLRSAIIVTLALWLPDLYLLTKGGPTEAVVVLMAMHLAIALVTYNALVRLAPLRRHSIRAAT